MKRNIIHIDEAKCTGCGLCVKGCAEGALQIVNGKAKLVSEIYCDGLGACIGECPEGALTIEQREAAGFDEAAVHEHLKKMEETAAPLPCGCPGSAARSFEPCPVPQQSGDAPDQASRLDHWPVQLALINPQAPFLKGRELVLAAHCAPFAYANFHRDFLGDKALAIACPKLDDVTAHLEKLTDILKYGGITKLTVVHMEVPCCFGLRRLVDVAMQQAGSSIPVEHVNVGVRGDIKK